MQFWGQNPELHACYFPAVCGWIPLPPSQCHLPGPVLHQSLLLSNGLSARQWEPLGVLDDSSQSNLSCDFIHTLLLELWIHLSKAPGHSGFCSYELLSQAGPFPTLGSGSSCLPICEALASNAVLGSRPPLHPLFLCWCCVWGSLPHRSSAPGTHYVC